MTDRYSLSIVLTRADHRIAVEYWVGTGDDMASISIEDAFTPANEVDDIRRFAGRDDEIQKLAWALRSEGTQIVIYGNRGIGKSSLARQLEKLASGDEAVSARLKTTPDRPFAFLPIFFRCDDSTDSIPRLLLRLVSDNAALAEYVPFRVEAVGSTAEVSGKLNLKVASIGGKGATSTTEAAQELETDVVSVFNNALAEAAERDPARDGVLLIIDEFDRLEDRTGLASLMKSLGPKGVRFALVGVSSTVEELVTEHESVARQLADGTVLVPPMAPEEIEDILDRAESLLEGAYRFLPAAREFIVSVAKGHPFLVHLVGRHALRRAAEQGSSDVDLDTCEQALDYIALNGSATVQESIYKTAIGSSYPREYILKTFARQLDAEIHTTDLYSSIARELGIRTEGISVYVGHLGSEKYGAVLEKAQGRYYRFSDSLFRAYAAARPYRLSKGD